MRPVVIWIWFCAYLNAAGWGLSSVHQLNAMGYGVVLAAGLITFGFWKGKNLSKAPCYWRKIFRRARKPFPLAFLSLAALATLGGILYSPNNYDALAYRIPRILHWLAADQWHWVHTFFDRINDRSCGIEWVSAPVIALLKTDRPLFLINVISFLFLPGLVFSVFTRLGVRRRVAWHWMWIVPSGYCFLLQAGSIGNDLFGAPFALAAVDLALRAKKTGSYGDFFASILAAAMMTSAKTASLPLLLPWAIAILPSARLLLRRPVMAGGVCIFAAFASALPTMYLNQRFSGDWSGANLDNGHVRHAVLLKVEANAGLLTLENLSPPVFPMAGKWNEMVEKHLSEDWKTRTGQLMEPLAGTFALPEMQIEEAAGLGFGVCGLLAASVLASFFSRKQNLARDSLWLKCIRWSPLISLLAVLAQSNLYALPRIMTPYYILLLPGLLAGLAQEPVVRKNWWRAAAGVVFIMAAGLLVIGPARPLFPALTILDKMASDHPGPPRLARMQKVYSIYRRRNDAFAPVRQHLPPGLKVLGFTTFDEPETSLWRPFSTLRIEYVCPEDTAADLKQKGVEYILFKKEMFGHWFPASPEEWLQKMNAEIVQSFPLDLRAATGPTEWYLIRLN